MDEFLRGMDGPVEAALGCRRHLRRELIASL